MTNSNKAMTKEIKTKRVTMMATAYKIKKYSTSKYNKEALNTAIF